MALGLSDAARREHALNVLAALEDKASKAVKSGATNADRLVAEAVQAMFEHSQGSRRDDESFTDKDEAHWLEKCLELYSLKNDRDTCGHHDLTMRLVSERASQLYLRMAKPDGAWGRIVDRDLFLRAVLWSTYKPGWIEGLKSDFNRGAIQFHPRLEWLKGVSVLTARKFLANERALEEIPYRYRDAVKADLTAFLAEKDEHLVATVLRRGLPGAAGAPILPSGMQPTLDHEHRATYDSSGNLRETAVPTPQGVLDVIAGYVDPKP